MITKFGKRFLTDYIAGNADFNNKDLALGIATSSDLAAADTNTRLGFEFYRLPVTLTSIDIQSNGSGGYNYFAIYKSTIPQDISGVITEIGLYPGVRKSTNFYDSKFVTSFENNTTWFDSSNGNPQLKPNATSPSFTAKIGESMVQVDVLASSSKEYKNSIIFNYTRNIQEFIPTTNEIHVIAFGARGSYGNLGGGIPGKGGMVSANLKVNEQFHDYLNHLIIIKI